MIDRLPKAVTDPVKRQARRITKTNKLNKEGKPSYYLDDVKVEKKGGT